MKKPWAYLDTSTYVKLYIKERGSEQARKAAREHHVLSSTILQLECFSAFSRRAQSGEIAESDFRKLIKLVRESARFVENVRLSDDVITKAEEVTLRSSARALDAIHIASALLFQDATDIKLTFITSDKKQHEAALREGFETLFIE